MEKSPDTLKAADREWELARIQAIYSAVSVQAAWIGKLFFYLTAANTTALVIAFNAVLADGRFSEIASHTLIAYSIGAIAGLSGFFAINLALNNASVTLRKTVATIEKENVVKKFMEVSAAERISADGFATRAWFIILGLVAIGGLVGGVTYSTKATQEYFNSKASVSSTDRSVAQPMSSRWTMVHGQNEFQLLPLLPPVIAFESLKRLLI